LAVSDALLSNYAGIFCYEFFIPVPDRNCQIDLWLVRKLLCIESEAK
jgi:hypothetical protein